MSLGLWQTKAMLLALRLLMSVALLVPSLVSAQSVGLASKTVATCGLSPIDGESAPSAFRDLGWREINAADHKLFSARIEDAAIIVLRDLTEPVNWAEAKTQAVEMASSLVAQADDPASAMLFMHDEAALVVLVSSNGRFTTVHCLYAGPEDPEQALLFDIMAHADQTKQGARGDPNLDSYSNHEIRLEAGKQLEVSTQAARYLPTADAQLSRVPTIKMGISLISRAEN